MKVTKRDWPTGAGVVGGADVGTGVVETGGGVAPDPLTER